MKNAVVTFSLTLIKHCGNSIPRSKGPHCVKNIQIWSFSGLYFPVFEPEKTPYLDTFHTVPFSKAVAVSTH